MACHVLPTTSARSMTYAERLDWFVKHHCTGRELDSCFGCTHGMSWGCSHPLHPKNQPAEGRGASDHGTDTP